MHFPDPAQDRKPPPPAKGAPVIDTSEIVLPPAKLALTPEAAAVAEQAKAAQAALDAAAQ